jgi:enoyl-CoA hydratase/3-hydroxypropionyl-coenzyme A dehydratase
MSSHLICDQTENIAVLTFNRPEQLNAMNRALMDDLIVSLQKVANDERVRVIIVTGNGKAFMAGADIKEYALQTTAQFESFQQQGQQIYETIEQAPKPVIAAVNGYAFGGGFEIALACDLIVASRDARLGLPEIQLDLIPGGGGTQRLPAKAGLNRALDLLLTGRQASAEELYSWGVVNRLTEPGEALAIARALANDMTLRSARALAHLKRLARMGARSEPGGFALEGQIVRELFGAPEGQARIQEFFQRSEERAARKRNAASGGQKAVS